MLPKQEHKPDRKFSMEKDGFWGEYQWAETLSFFANNW